MNTLQRLLYMMIYETNNESVLHLTQDSLASNTEQTSTVNIMTRIQ